MFISGAKLASTISPTACCPRSPPNAKDQSAEAEQLLTPGTKAEEIWEKIVNKPPRLGYKI